MTQIARLPQQDNSASRPSKWRALFETQWKWMRGMLLGLSVLMFALPLLSLRTSVGARSEAAFIAAMQGWSAGYALSAAGIGLLVAMLSWSYDHRLRHVYALSLPIPRWQYALIRFSAGLVLLVLPVVALLVGAEVVAHSASVPATLHAYPIALTLRFAFATLVAYAVFFAISSATPRTAGYILGTVGLIIVVQIALPSSGTIGYFFDALLATPGLLAVFSGRWMLIDV